MARPGRLTNPPITEALVDFRTERGRPLQSEELAPLSPEIRDRFPKIETRNKYQARLAPRLGQPPDAHTEDLGFYGLFLRSEDQTRVAQFRVDGFTFSNLGRYTTADDLFVEAFDLWERFMALAPADGVSRVALRYVNRLALAFRGGDDLSRFLRGVFDVPPEVPQGVKEFTSRIVLPVAADESIEAIVIQRLRPAVEEADSPYILDVDVFRRGEFSIAATDLAPLLHELREIKNEMFFAFITDEALERYR
jgi:uncharacterized protein (TIGR04255 family)